MPSGLTSMLVACGEGLTNLYLTTCGEKDRPCSRGRMACFGGMERGESLEIRLAEFGPEEGSNEAFGSCACEGKAANPATAMKAAAAEHMSMHGIPLIAKHSRGVNFGSAVCKGRRRLQPMNL